jgi:hypothetical protein
MSRHWKSDERERSLFQRIQTKDYLFLSLNIESAQKGHFAGHTGTISGSFEDILRVKGDVRFFLSWDTKRVKTKRM